MLTLYSLVNGQLSFCAEEGSGADASAPLDAEQLARAAWIDLHEPTDEEEVFVEQQLGVNIPTREQIFGLEMANRIIEEDNVIYAAASILIGSRTDTPSLTTVFFIFRSGVLVTVRHSPVTAFDVFVKESCRPAAPKHKDGYDIYVALIELIVDRLAEVLGQAGSALDIMTQNVFDAEKRFRRGEIKDFRRVLRRLGARGDMLSKARESLLSLLRINSFLASGAGSNPRRSALEGHFNSIASDVHALTDHVNYLSSRISLLLDATIGLINLEQNGTIKIFSVASVVFLPPTLIASIYGMNFHLMPELDWTFGYPFAIGLMILSAVLPYLLFKRKGWL